MAGGSGICIVAPLCSSSDRHWRRGKHQYDIKMVNGRNYCYSGPQMKVKRTANNFNSLDSKNHLHNWPGGLWWWPGDNDITEYMGVLLHPAKQFKVSIWIIESMWWLLFFFFSGKEWTRGLRKDKWIFIGLSWTISKVDSQYNPMISQTVSLSIYLFRHFHRVNHILYNILFQVSWPNPQLFHF